MARQLRFATRQPPKQSLRLLLSQLLQLRSRVPFILSGHTFRCGKSGMRTIVFTTFRVFVAPERRAVDRSRSDREAWPIDFTGKVGQPKHLSLFLSGRRAGPARTSAMPQATQRTSALYSTMLLETVDVASDLRYIIPCIVAWKRGPRVRWDNLDAWSGGCDWFEY
jgi:hypothetical protein